MLSMFVLLSLGGLIDPTANWNYDQDIIVSKWYECHCKVTADIPNHSDFAPVTVH